MSAATQTAGGRLTQAERTEISDQRMFEVTVELINARGTAETSLKDVGVLAGYSRGLAGHRFGNKDNLYGFVLGRLGVIWLAQLKNATDGVHGLIAVEKALDQHYQYLVDAPDQVRAFYTLWFESTNARSELNNVIRSIHERRHADVVQWISSDLQISERIKQQAESIAAQFCASVVGIVYYWLANPNEMVLAKTLHDGLKQTMARLLDDSL